MRQTVLRLGIMVSLLIAAVVVRGAEYPDLLSAVKAGTVRASFHGAGGSNVAVRIQRTSGGPLYVRVAPGTYFKPGEHVQAQVVLGTQWLDLRNNQVVMANLETACCHIGRPAASSEHVMRPTACPDPRLLRLCSSVDLRRDNRDAIQSAVWAISNNATRRELFGYGSAGTEHETLRLLERANVDVGTLRLKTRSTSRALHLW